MDGYIRNIVIACPNRVWTGSEWSDGPCALGGFYAALLGWTWSTDRLGVRPLRRDSVTIGKDARTWPHLVFGDGPTPEYRPPRWSDPERPRQVHLEFPVRALDAAEALALSLGASRVQDKGEYRSYTDPIGHSFCLYGEGAAGADPRGRPLSGQIGRVVFDCFSPRGLAPFYQELLRMPTRVLDTPDRVVIAREDGSGPQLGFQHAVFQAPRWPDPAYPQQLHLDLHFDDQPTAQELAERLGARRLRAMGGSCPVYADPAAHPFCLCTAGQ